MSSNAVLSSTVHKPEHVPDSAVYDLDTLADPGIINNPHARALEILRDAPSVFWTPRNGGHWVLNGHRVNFNASRDTENFSNSPILQDQLAAMIAALPAGAPKPLIPAPITYDPPVHNIFRTPLQKVFSPKAMVGLKEDIRALAVELIESIKPAGRCEFMAAVAEPLPVTVFLKLFGLPVEKQSEYRTLVKEHLAATDFSPASLQARLQKVAAGMRNTILERRDIPQGDIISMLWLSNFDGRPATQHDLENYCVILFLAGLDTVMNGMGLGVIHLAEHPELQMQLRANPDLIGDAVEELLRRYTFTLPQRIASKDFEFEGVAIKKGEKITLLLPTADLDPAEFSNPEEFNLARENKVHIAFGAGPHRCLGSHLARLELQILYEEMLLRLPEFRIDPSHAIRYHGGPVWGPETLYLTWESHR
jgi:cytochrome P450